MMVDRKRWLSLLCVVAAIVLLLVAVNSYVGRPPRAASGKPVSVRIAIAKLIDSAPIIIAQERGFFKAHGIDAEIIAFPSGKDALASLLQGQADFATVADMAFAMSVMRGYNGRIVASMSSSLTENSLVARRDKGIVSTGSLNGRTIGVTPETSGDYFLDELLVYYGIDKKSVKIVPLAPSDMVDALVSGKVDAVSTWVPHTTTLLERLGDNGISFYAGQAYRMYWLLVSSGEVVETKKAAVSGILAALDDTVRLMAKDPAAVQPIVAERMGMPFSTVARLWNNYYYALSLDEALLLTLENQVRLELRQRRRGSEPLPNFYDYIYPDALRILDPDAVTLIR